LHATIIIDADEFISMKAADDTSSDDESSSSSDEVTSSGTVASPPLGSPVEAESITDAHPTKQSSTSTTASSTSPSYTMVDDSDQVNLPPLSPSLPSKPLTSSTSLSDKEDADAQYASSLHGILQSSSPASLNSAHQATSGDDTDTSSSSSSSNNGGRVPSRNIHILTLSTPIWRQHESFGEWRVHDMNYIVDQRDVDPLFDADVRSVPVIFQLMQRQAAAHNNDNDKNKKD
jgi:hypothetical protein